MTWTERLASAFGLTEGQVYTVATSLTVAVTLLVLGLPSLHDIAPGLPPASSASAPLELPGSPAVAEVIRADDDAPITSGGDVAAPLSPPGTLVPDPGPGAGDPETGSVPEGTPPGEDQTPSENRPPTALVVAEGRYASASGPLLLAGEPGAHLPVGLRLGRPDKQSYLRLRGTGTTLRLGLSTEPGHQIGEVIEVRACAITAADWELEDGSSLSAAPEVDLEDCAVGAPFRDGWAFELGAVDLANGVALVPAGPATGSFQVTFLGRAAGP